MATHSTRFRPERRHADAHRASAASVLLVLRGDRDAGDGMAATAEPSPSPDKQHDQPHEKQQADDHRAQVHEVTESSSDESADEEREEPPAAGAGAARAVIPTSPPMAGRSELEEEAAAAAEEVVVQEYYPTRNVADMVYLFTNDRLKEQPATVVLRSDPYCIPRATDNVPEYRPRFNPLSILEAEEKLLPGHFRLDPTEGVPGADESARRAEQGGGSSLLLPLPSAAASSAGGVFVGKSTAFMGTMPRQQEFMEFPISENIFHSFKTAPAPPPTSPHPGLFASKLYHGVPSASAADSNRDASAGTESPAALADAVLLSSMLHAADAPVDAAVVGASTPTGTLESMFPPSASSLATDPPSMHDQPVDAVADAAADALTNYLPARQPATSHEEHFLDDIARGYAYLAAPHHSDATSAIPSLFVDDADGSVSSATAAAATMSATTPQHDPKARASLQPVSKKPRGKNVFRQCTAPGCSKGARGKSGLCQRHGGGRRCSVPDCPKGAQGSTKLCLFHGGGYRCKVDGCMTGARGTSGLCAKHGGYKRAKDSGAESGGEASAATPKAKRAKK